MPDDPSRESGQSRALRRLAQADGARPVDRFAWERELRESDLPFGTRGVLAILGSWMDRDGTRARPSLDTLAAACGLTRRQVSNHLRPALELGWLARDSGRGPGSATTYAARLPARRPATTPVPVESGQPIARTSGQPASHTASSTGNPLPESGHSATGKREAGSRPPRPDHVKTTLSASQEAAVIDPETIRQERDQSAADDEHPDPFGPEHVQSIAVANGARPEWWTPSRQERVRAHLVRALDPHAVNLAKPMLLELAHRGIGTFIDSYVAAILASDSAAEDVAKLARAGRKRMPKPVMPSPLDALPPAARAELLASVEATLVDAGDVLPDWQHDPQREQFANIIDQRARQLARQPERVSA